MKSFWGWTVVGTGVFALLVAIGLGLALFVGLPELASNIEIDGERLDLARLRTDHWALMGLGVVVAAAVITSMVVLALILGVGAAFFGVLASGAAIALVIAPIGLLVWWLWKQRPGEPTMPSS
jgi:hypothetical protein